MSLTEVTENRLWAAVSTRAGSRALDDACEAALYRFIRAGVARMEGDDRLGDADRVALAEQNIIRLVDGILEETEGNSVPVESFERARRHLCPLWPFCEAEGE